MSAGGVGGRWSRGAREAEHALARQLSTLRPPAPPTSRPLNIFTCRLAATLKTMQARGVVTSVAGEGR